MEIYSNQLEKKNGWSVSGTKRVSKINNRFFTEDQWNRSTYKRGEDKWEHTVHDRFWIGHLIITFSSISVTDLTWDCFSPVEKLWSSFVEKEDFSWACQVSIHRAKLKWRSTVREKLKVNTELADHDQRYRRFYTRIKIIIIRGYTSQIIDPVKHCLVQPVII